MSKISQKELTEKLRSKLAASGLNAKDAKLLKFETLLADQAEQLNIPAYAGFKIPYFDVHGKETSFFRVRYLEETRRGFLKQTDAKDIRYIQPPNSVNEVYLPPFINWDTYFKGDSPIVITEGELKAACATKHGVPTIGLGGVWCFKSKKRGLNILPIFSSMGLKNKKVYVVFDSDAIRNYQVMGAENELCRQLLNLGGIPHIVRLPDIEGVKKTGLDDYIVANGIDTFLEHLKTTATPYKAGEELHRLNEEVVYVTDPGLIYRFDLRCRLSVRNFIDHAFSTRIVRTEIQNSKGDIRVEEKSAPKEWIKWPYRAVVRRIVYRPGQPLITGDDLNMWQGWGCEPQKGDISPWNELLDHIFENKPEARHWFESWVAHQFQFPGQKLYTAVVIWGVMTGTGKTLVAHTIMRLMGRDNTVQIKTEDLERGSNDYAENKQFVLGEEIKSSENRRSFADRLKALITQDRIRVNVKYVPVYEAEDVLNYYFTSNHPDAFFVEDNDRRFFIHEAPSYPKPTSFYEAYDRWYKSEAGAGALFDYFLNFDLKGFNPKARAPMTASKRDMIENSKSELGRWVAMLKEDPDTALRIDGKVLTYALWRVEDLLVLFDPQEHKRSTANAMSRELKQAGFVKAGGGMGCPTTQGHCKLWALRKVSEEVMESPAVAGALYNTERAEAPKKWRRPHE